MDKKNLLENITRLPNWLNYFLLKVNLWPEKVYGKAYLLNKKNTTNFNVEERLLEIVNYAIREVPYYQRRYKEVKSIADFNSNIGFIDKIIVVENFNLFLSETIDQNQYVFGTSGGTFGKPLKFLSPKNRHEKELATMHNLWNRVGWNYNTRGVLRNHHLKPNEVYKINPITKEYIFDNFRMNSEYALKVYMVLKENDIYFIHAYPSAAYQFCMLCNDLSLDLSFIKAFLCGSEAVLDFQYNLICKEMGLKIFSWYGHSEKLILGGYCEKSNNFHIEPHYGYFELIDESNNIITQKGRIGEIVGTTFHNQGMPLIRYRTGDYAEYVGDNCELCGRKMQIIRNIKGHRDKNMIFKKDGTYITTTALNLHNKLYTYIDGVQYYQKEKGELIIYLVKNKNYKKEHEKLFIDHFSKSFGRENTIYIKYVDRLQMQPNGKFELLISSFNNKKEN